MTETVREAMVPEPASLGAEATAREAGASFAENEDVRALFVCEEDGTLLGVITRKTLVREVVAAGRDPNTVRMREIAEPPYNTLDAGLSLEDGYRELEAHELERIAVVEEGRLVGVLSRAVVQRRLAEDEDTDEEELQQQV